MKLGGNVYIDDDHVGTFVVDADDEIVMTTEGNRLTAEFVFQWALENHKSVRFEPVLESVV